MKKMLLVFTLLVITSGFTALFAQDSLWTEQVVPFEEGVINNMYYVNADTGWAVGRNDGTGEAAIIYTGNGGVLWTLQTSSFNGVLHHIHMVDTQVGYAVGQNYDNGYVAMVKTVDGVTWNLQALPEIHGSLREVQFLTAEKGWAVGRNLDSSSVFILYTEDGVIWQEADYPRKDAHLHTVSFSDENNGWAAGTNWDVDPGVPFIFRTIDGGKTWEEMVQPVVSGSFWDITFISPDTGWVAGGLADSSGIWETMNAGQSWQLIEPELAATSLGKLMNSPVSPSGGKAYIKCFGISWISDISWIFAGLEVSGNEGRVRRVEKIEYGGWSEATPIITPKGVNPQGVSSGKEQDPVVDREDPPITIYGNTGEQPRKPAIHQAWGFTYAIESKEGKPVLVISLDDWCNTAILRINDNGEVVCNTTSTGVQVSSVTEIILVGNNNGNLLDATRITSENAPNLDWMSFVTGTGDDEVTGSLSRNNHVAVSGGADNITGGEESDDFINAPDANGHNITGLGGNDTYRQLFDGHWSNSYFPVRKVLPKLFHTMNSSADTLIDDAGLDTLDYIYYPYPVNLNLDLQDIRQVLSSTGYAVCLVGQFEHCIGTSFDDRIQVKPLDVARLIDGGAHVNGDTLVFDAMGQYVEDTGDSLKVAGYAPVVYVNFEVVLIVNDATSVEEEVGLPRQFALGQNYPNPFNPTTLIPFSLPMDSRVTISIYDIKGRHVTTLLEEPVSAGHHEVAFDASELASGIYLCRLKAGVTVKIRKLVLQK
ncbi:T9SS type A sorting domain-containing protein [bacterium]|nr:T9SS type A sorting domain-containing protein [bacterium]